MKIRSMITGLMMVLACGAALPGSGTPTALDRFETELNDSVSRAVAATVRIVTSNNRYSGVLISPAGHILTLKNVGNRGSQVKVIGTDGRVLDGQILRTWPLNGYALVKIEATDAPYVKLGDSKSIRPGDPAVSVGNAFGSARGRRMSCGANYGVISGRRKFRQTGIYFEGEAFLTDARINRGSEGGPLIDLAGDLIGINGTPVIAIETNTNVSLALPLESVIADIKKYGRTAAAPRLFDVLELDARGHGSGGLLVKSVSAVAANAGVRSGDLVSAVNGTPIEDPAAFNREFAKADKGRLLPITIYRNGQVLSRWLPLKRNSPVNGWLLGEARRRAARRASPSLVKIHVARSGRGAAVDPGLMAHQQNFQLGTGPFSGVVYRSDGYVLTSSFNLSGNVRSVEVELEDGRKLPAEIRGRDLGRNIALLKVDAQNLSEPRRAKAGDVGVGSTVLALGSTFGNGLPTIDRGIVSALNRSAGKAIQIDANLTPGNFGGPAVDLDGRLIGINIPQANRDGSAQGTAGGQFSGSGIGFVIPLEDIDFLFEQLRDSKTLEPAFLGIRFETERTLEGAEITHVISEIGLLKPGISQARLRTVRTLAELKTLHDMQPTGAAAAGLQPGDVIVEFNGHRIPSWNVLLNIIGRLNAGDEVVFVIERLGARRKIDAVLGPRGRVF